MDYKSLYECILNVYTTFGIDTFPIDCFSIVRQCGYRIVKYSDLDCRKKMACQTLSTDACLLERTLFYESTAHPRRIQFSIAHELGHVFLKTDDEDSADEFASHFLAPRILIHKYGYRNAEQLHDTFGLSYAAANRTLLSYMEWFRNISYSTTRSPSEAELQLEHIFFSQSNSILSTDYFIEPNQDDSQDYSKTDICSEFMRFLNIMHGDFGFKIAEKQWLYGNDL